MTACTEQCLKNQTKYKKVLASFLAKYPLFCHSCGGYGYTVYQYDPSPTGISLSSGHMEDVEVCPDCEESERSACALCGKLMENDQRVCGCPENTGVPQEPECWCWEVDFWNQAETSVEEAICPSSL